MRWRDAPPVHRLERDRFEDEEVDGALQQVVGLAHGRSCQMLTGGETPSPIERV